MTATTVAPAPLDLRHLKVWISAPSGVDLDETVAALLDLGALPLTRRDVMVEFPDDLVEGLEACAETLLTADVLAHLGAPDPVEVLLAQAASVQIVALDE